MNSKHWSILLAACAAVAAVVTATRFRREPRSHDDTASGTTEPRNALVSSNAPHAAGRAPAEVDARHAPVAVFDDASTLVRGHVVDAGGRPLEAVQVAVAPPCRPTGRDGDVLVLESALKLRSPESVAFARTESGADGAFELRVPAADEFYISLRRAGSVGLDLVHRSEESELDLGTLTLAAGAAMTGRVVDEAGRPIAGAQVLRDGTIYLTDGLGFDWNDAQLATSAADGTFTLDCLPLGRTELEVRAAGFVPACGPLFADGLRLPEKVIQLARSAPITGRVIGLPAGTPLAVTFWLQQEDETRTVPCADDGTFEIDGLAPDHAEFSLSAARPGGGPFSRDTVTSSIQVRPGMRDVELRVPLPVSYRVLVVDASTRTPLTDIAVGLLESMDFESGRSCSVASSVPGEYTLSTILPWADEGTAIAVSRAGYQGIVLGGARHVPGETHDFGVVTLEPLEPTRIVVADARDGTPLAGARISATLEQREGDDCFYAHVRSQWPPRSDRNTGWNGTSAADGAATAHFSRRQRYWIAVEASEHAPLGTWLDVGEHAPAELALRVDRGGAVALRLLDERALSTIPDSAIEHERTFDGDRWGGRDRVRTDAAGRARLEHLPAGLHRFWPAHADPDSAQIARVTEGSAVELTLLAGVQKVRLHGRITEHGVAVVGAMVACEGYETATDLDGRYELSGLEPGDDDFEITHPRLGPIDTRALTLGAPETLFDVDLAPLVVAGTVRDDAGKPLASAAVWLGLQGPDDRFEGLYSSTANAFLHSTTTGADGRFRFDGVQPRDALHLVCQLRGFQAVRIGPLVFPPDGSALELVPVLQSAAVLEVVLQGWDVRTVGLPTVTATWSGSTPLSADDREQKGEGVANTIDSAALRFRFDMLAPGSWHIELRDMFSFGDEDEDLLARAVVELRAGRNEPLVLHR